jgi:penicillin amidase
VYGAIPNRVGLDGHVPVSWADGSRGWQGWLEDAEYPRVVDPIDGRLWTANARVVNGSMLARLGDGSYEIGSRARIIRNRLFSRERFDEHDLLRIQLDASATFLERWRGLLLDVLTTDAVRDRVQRASLRDIVRDRWTDQAAPDSVAYRMTRAFRSAVFDRVTAFVLAECYEADPAFDYAQIRRREAAIWRLVADRPQHFLAPQYHTWNEMLLEAVDATIEEAERRYGSDLRDRTWSEYNVTTFRHPLSASIPFSSRWLDMPAAPVPGDLFTPRLHWGSDAASERMVVSPGREDEGILQMPIGQGGHPMSPFYANSHRAWINGEPSPFLPGPPQHTLTLSP